MKPFVVIYFCVEEKDLGLFTVLASWDFEQNEPDCSIRRSFLHKLIEIALDVRLEVGGVELYDGLELDGDGSEKKSGKYDDVYWYHLLFIINIHCYKITRY